MENPLRPDAADQLLPAFEFEHSVEAQFYPILREMCDYHDRPVMAERSDVALRLYRGESKRQDALRAPSGAYGTFIFDLEDFRCYLAEFDSLLGKEFRKQSLDTQKVLDVAMSLFVGSGLGKHIAALDLSDNRIPSTPQRQRAIKDVFTNKDDIVELFRASTTDEDLAFMSRHIHDENVMNINALRLALRYLSDAKSTSFEVDTLEKMQEYACSSLQGLIDDDATFYVELALYNQGSRETGEKTFVYYVPDWLIAIAAGPTRAESIQHLYSRAWRK